MAVGARRRQRQVFDMERRCLPDDRAGIRFCAAEGVLDTRLERRREPAGRQPPPVGVAPEVEPLQIGVGQARRLTVS
jgi:hypothetical protein